MGSAEIADNEELADEYRRHAALGENLFDQSGR
jgi:hypothetical protein